MRAMQKRKIPPFTFLKDIQLAYSHKLLVSLPILVSLAILSPTSYSQSQDGLVRDFLNSLQTEASATSENTNNNVPLSSLTHPLAQRISKDLSEREEKLRNLPMALPSLPTVKTMWQENRLLENSIRNDLRSANVRDQLTGEVLTAQYFDLMRKNFKVLTHLTRIQIEQFSMERGDSNAMTMSLEFLGRELPPAWAAEIGELKKLWAEKRSEFSRQKAAANQQQKELKDKENKERNANIQKIIQKHQAKIVALNLGAAFLNARPIINIAGVEVPYRPFNEWVALLLENPSIEDIAPISLVRGRSKGIRIKLKGQPSIGILFSHEGKDLFLTHTTDRENASPVRTLSEKMQVTNFMMKLAGDPMPNHF
jgi:hypothetical protein